MFDPGDAWTYGVGIDWAGFLVSAVDGRSIDQFVYEEVLEPLQMADTMFETDGAAGRVADVKIRGTDGKFDDASFIVPLARPEVYGMGQALHGTALDYTKLIRLVLNDGEVNGRRILSSNSMALMKQNQIGSMRIPLPMTSYLPPSIAADLDLFPWLGIPLTHTTGFVRNEADVPGRRRAGSLTWAGFLNTHYWIDPTTGIGAVLYTQQLPFIEPRFASVYAAFETAVYCEYSKA
jgi:CubicO group peptidase (beta-lactamase class C family)